jgi:hypothetical protein
MTDLALALAALTRPDCLYTRAEVLTRPCPIPASPGLYAWHFRRLPPCVALDGCVTSGCGTLLYVGISPHRATSTQNLRKRITYHYRGNAYGSTLRLTLGVLLAQQSDLPLRRVGSGKRLTFTHAGEQWLDQWMAENALVAWYAHPEPWLIEAALLRAVRCPLNIADNEHEPFASTLSRLRREAMTLARWLPIANEANQRRGINFS